MSRSFQVRVGGDPRAKLEYARQAAARQGVRLEGDTRFGRFSGLISGSYEISGAIANVRIDAKPALVSWEYVERQLRAFLEG